jgi:hypothetical protein
MNGGRQAILDHEVARPGRPGAPSVGYNIQRRTGGILGAGILHVKHA